MHAVSGSEHTASHAVGDSGVGFSCWDTPSDSSACSCMMSVWVCSCWDSSSVPTGTVSLCACRDAVASLVPGPLPSCCASSVYSEFGQASTRASSGSAATSYA